MFSGRAARSSFPALLFAAILPLSHARTADNQHATDVPIVIELFTS
jgi:hypothetical protein